MATLTSNANLDDASRTAGEAFTLNGAILTVRTDTRWHANSPDSMTGTIGNVTISSTLGGGYYIDGTKVRWLAYDTGSGNVPEVGTSITQAAPLTAGRKGPPGEGDRGARGRAAVLLSRGEAQTQGRRVVLPRPGGQALPDVQRVSGADLGTGYARPGRRPRHHGAESQPGSSLRGRQRAEASSAHQDS